jgi:transposase InsO family protein
LRESWEFVAQPTTGSRPNSTAGTQQTFWFYGPLTEHPFYGVERLAIHFDWSQVKTRRIRILAGITVTRPGTKKRHSSSAPAEIAAAPNALKRFAVCRDETKPQAGFSYAGMVDAAAWVQDFTHLKFGGEEHYLAVVLDLKTRQVVGWRLGTRHSSELTLAAVLGALSKHPAPPQSCIATKAVNT